MKSETNTIYGTSAGCTCIDTYSILEFGLRTISFFKIYKHFLSFLGWKTSMLTWTIPSPNHLQSVQCDCPDRNQRICYDSIFIYDFTIVRSRKFYYGNWIGSQEIWDSSQWKINCCKSNFTKNVQNILEMWPRSDFSIKLTDSLDSDCESWVMLRW